MNTNELHVDVDKMPYDRGISPDWHRHECPKCNHSWGHDGFEMMISSTKEEFDRAHHCPKCGTEQRHCAPVQKERRKAA